MKNSQRPIFLFTNIIHYKIFDFERKHHNDDEKYNKINDQSAYFSHNKFGQKN